MFFKSDLRKIFPYAKESILDILVNNDELFKQYGISDNYARMSMFLAQAGHETAGFSTLVEYGSPNYFKKYDNRMDLGNRIPGDGYRYRGRGMFQITGRYNYNNYGKILGEDFLNNPDLVAAPEYALKTALAYWDVRDLNKLSDQHKIELVTRRINGGLNGLEQRKKYYDKLIDHI